MMALSKRTVLEPRAVRHCDAEVMRIEEAAAALHDRDLARLRHAGEAAGQLADDLVLMAAQQFERDLRLVVGDAVGAKRRRLVHDRGGMQQRLRGNAADVEADAAESRAALDEHDFLAEVGGAEGGRIAAGTGAEDENLSSRDRRCRNAWLRWARASPASAERTARKRTWRCVRRWHRPRPA